MRDGERSHNLSQPDEAPQASGPDSQFFVELDRLGQALTTRYGSPYFTLDILFLAYLLKSSRFGFFTFGPVTIDVRLVESIVEATTPSGGSGRYEHVYADDLVRFSKVLMQEVRRSGRSRIDELHYLYAFMRCGEGLPSRVFSELGVTIEEVEEYVRSAREHGVSTVDEKLYSPEEAAEYLGVHVKTVRSWIRAGRLRASRLAGQRALRIRASDLQALLEPVEPGDDL